MHKGNVEPSYKGRAGYHATLLGGIALITTAFLAVGDLTTRDTIALRLAEDLKSLLAEVVPPSLHDNNLLEDIVSLDVQGNTLFRSDEIKVYRAIHSNKMIAAAYEVFGKGYAGDIRVLLGVDRDGNLLGVRVVSHTETPGLGDKIEVRKSSWIDDFTGHSLANTSAENWAVKKDGGEFDQFSGATITPRAVVTAVKDGLHFFQVHKTEILASNALASTQTSDNGTM